MAQILVQDLSETAARRLKMAAEANRRTPEEEARLALERVYGLMTPEEVRGSIEEWQKRFAGKTFTPSSADLIREDRER